MLKKITKIVCGVITVLGAISIYLYIDKSDIVDIAIDYYTKEHSIIVSNHYGINIKNNFVETTDNFSPTSRQDILNIFYTVLSSNLNDFTFYCNSKYEKCIDDIKAILDDSSLLSHINNFVSPYNTYKSIKVNYTNGGKVNLKIVRIYDINKINMINQKIDELYPTLVSSTNTTTQNIKKIHDYIINNTKYDTTYNFDTNDNDSSNAYGVLFTGLGICTGYTDLVKLFLDRMGILNYRISNDTHAWNLVYLDGQWLHLDTTWDDPVSSNGKNYLEDDYFLVTSQKLYELDLSKKVDGHKFNENIYPN